MYCCQAKAARGVGSHAQGAVVLHEHLVQHRQGKLAPTWPWQSAAECSELAGDKGVDGREVVTHVDAAESAWSGDVAACWW